MTNETDETVVIPVQNDRPIYVPDEDPELTAEEQERIGEAVGKTAPEIELEPGEIDELNDRLKRQMEESSEHLHELTVLARFTPTSFEVWEDGIYARVFRIPGRGPWTAWRVELFPTMASTLPQLLGVFLDRTEALQTASDAVDRLLEEKDDTVDDIPLITESIKP
jgi:hypothetical protein